MNSVLGAADCVIIATAHSIYSSLSMKDFKKDCIIVDPVRLLNKDDFLNSRLTYIALGAWLLKSEMEELLTISLIKQITIVLISLGIIGNNIDYFY